MDRRRFTRTLAMAVGLTGLPAAGRAGHGSDWQPFDEINLRIDGVRTRVRHFMALAENGLLGVDLTLPVPRMDAARFDLGDVPLLGQIISPTLPRQFAGAEQVGRLHLFGHTLVLLPDSPVTAARTHVWITHRNAVFRPPASLKPMPGSRRLTVAGAQATPAIGTAVRQDGLILCIVPPTVLDGMAFETGAPA